MLFVAHGFNVNFHLCTEDHHVMSSFGDASLLCEHCRGHHHHEHMTAEEFESHLEVLHFGAKCCCEDFESEIGFTEGYTFSTEKPTWVSLPCLVMKSMVHPILDESEKPSFLGCIHEKIPKPMTGRLRTIFFSSLRLDPDVC